MKARFQDRMGCFLPHKGEESAKKKKERQLKKTQRLFAINLYFEAELFNKN